MAHFASQLDILAQNIYRTLYTIYNIYCEGLLEQSRTVVEDTRPGRIPTMNHGVHPPRSPGN